MLIKVVPWCRNMKQYYPFFGLRVKGQKDVVDGKENAKPGLKNSVQVSTFLSAVRPVF
jgi:hypothetical protein